MQVKLRIAVMLNASWNIVNFRMGLLNALARDGHHIIVMAPRDSFSDRIPFEYHDLPMKPDGMNPFQELVLLWRILRLHRRTRPDVVLQFTPKPNIYGSFAARLMGIPAISNVAGLGTMFNRPLVVRGFFKALYRMALKGNDRVFFQNSEDMGAFVREGLVARNRAVRIPGSGIDLVRFLPRPRSASSDEVTFLLVSRLLWEKGVGDFAEAARKARSEGIRAKFLIAGFLDSQNPGAVPRSRMESWVTEGAIEYLGARDDVRGIMADADCIVLPSYYREGVPRTLLEAAAMAKPIIAYENVGTRDVVAHGENGMLVPSRDVSALVEAIRGFAAMSIPMREEMGRLGRVKMEKEFDEGLVVQAYRAVLEKIAPVLKAKAISARA